MSKEVAKKILLVDSDADMIELVSSFLSLNFNCEITSAQSFNQAVGILGKAKIDCVISEFKDGSQNTSMLIESCNQLEVKPPVVIMSASTEEAIYKEISEKSVFAIVRKPMIFRNLKEVLTQIIQLRSEGKSISSTENQYCSVPISLIEKFEKVEFDLFVMLGNSHYVKIFNSKDEFDFERVSHYKKKGIQFFYVNSNDCFKQFDEILEVFVTMKFSEKITDEEMRSFLNISEKGHQVIMNDLRKMGISLRTEKVIKSCAKMAMNVIQSSDILTNVLEHTRNSDQNYNGRHSATLVYVAAAIWAEIKPEFSMTGGYDLAIASLLHDCSLTQDINLERCLYMDKAAQNPTLKNDSEVIAYVQHPFNSYEILMQANMGLPEEVSAVVRNHHENPLGTGFPLKLTAEELDMRSLVFIVSEVLVNQMMTMGNQFKMTNFLQTYSSWFNHPKLKPIYQLLSRQVLVKSVS